MIKENEHQIKYIFTTCEEIMKKELYNKKIDPQCRYCRHGQVSPLGGILCEKYGLTTPDFHCKKFAYDPLKREPMPTAVLPQFDPEDFAL